MKEKILKLRAEGKSYRQISKELGCSKGTISYHLGKGQKDKTKARQDDLRKNRVYSRNVENFKGRVIKSLRHKADDFQRERKDGKLGKRDINFSYKDVMAKYGNEPMCYLTGRKIDISKARECHFDHVIPVAKGGDNSLNNLGIACRAANMAKGDLTIEEFIELCKDVLMHHGYSVV